jgi:hypothetical protein
VARCAVVPFKKGGEGGGSEYILPVATKTTLGGVKSSDEAGAIKVDSLGKMTYNAPASTPLSAPDWETNTAYPENALVEYGDNIYICLIAHTSGTFADDLANGKWKLVSMTLTAATSSELGGVKSNSADGGVTVDSDGKMTINLPKATSSTLGGVKIGDGLSVTADGTLSATGGGTSIDEWTAGNTYAAGDFVTYQNLLYKCITGNSDSAWTPANWQKIGDVNFTGATSSANGTNGLVPQPTTSDVSKFLCGDGTWKSAGVSGTYVNRDVLFSGNTAIAENAVINLTKSYTDYDYLLIEKEGTGYSCFVIEQAELGVRTFLIKTADNGIAYFSVSVLSQTQIKLYDVSATATGSTLYRITGLKFLPNPNNYSTTEQEIGTWIDGKKLYQKTYSLISPYISDGRVELAELPVGVNTGNVVAIDAIITSNSNGAYTPQWLNRTEDGYCIFIRPNRKIVCEVDSENKENKPLFVTIKYTKV